MRNLFQRKKHLFNTWIVLTLFCLSPLVWGNELSFLKQSTKELSAISNTLSSGQTISNAALSKAVQTAKRRQDAIRSNLKSQSRDMKQFLLPTQITSKLPKALTPYLEKEIANIEGTLEIRAALNLNRKGEVIQYLLHTANDKLYYLYFIDNIPNNLKSGTIIKLTKGFSIAMPNGYDELMVLSSDLKIIQAVTAIPDSFGQQKAIAILVNFQDQPTNQPFTKEAVSDVTFNAVNRQYYESSYNQTTVIGSTIGWFTIPLNSTTDCTTVANLVPSLAEQAAIRNGVDLSPYSRRLYFFPYKSDCGWAGLGNVGKYGAYSNAWFNGYNDLRVTAHELGHNVGLWHSNRFQCTGPSSEGNCTHVEYGDYADTMGWGYGTHFNAYQKEVLGWLNYGSSPAIQTITATGTYAVAPYEMRGATPAANIKALKILKQTLADGSKDYYYLEFRQPVGFDAPLGSCGNSCDFTRGVLIHQGNSVNTNSSHILDPSPVTTNPALIALLPGQVFTDPTAANGGVTITTNSINASGAVVTVKIGNTPPPVCTRNYFSMSISPLQYVSPGGSATYSFSVTNNDTLACAASTFQFYVNPTTGWVQPRLSATSATIAPGSTATIPFTVKVSTAAPLAVYRLSINAFNPTPPASGGEVITSVGVR